MSQALRGRGILVTRPAAQAARLCDLIQAAGGTPIRFPTLAIQPVADPIESAQLLAEPWHLIFFVSANAVNLAHQLVPATAWQAEYIATIGAATGRQLAALGRPADLLPEGSFESESLLAMPELQHMTGQRVLIVRGQGGRTLLGETLKARGAVVHHAEVYQRVCPAVDPASLIPNWRQQVTQVTVTSTEVLENLVKIIGTAGRTLLVDTPLAVISSRTQARATEFGLARTGLADNATDAAIITALVRQQL